MSLVQTLAGSRVARKIADAGFIRVAHSRVARLDRMNVGQVQERTLLELVRKAKHTRFGREHEFGRIHSVADFQARVPVLDYEFFWERYWKDAYPVLDNLTWPGKIPYYALSSGTTSGATKYVPISWEMVRSNRHAALTTMAFFKHSYPHADLFKGKFFFLGGSTDLRTQSDGSFAGDLSGIAAKEVTSLMRPYTFPSLEMTLLSDWETKIGILAEQAVKEPITALSGIPSWMLILFDRVKAITGKRTVGEVWPDLRLVIHGGTSFDGYRDLFKREIGNAAVKFCEVYPCSEGFIATEDSRFPGLMRVVPDHDIFFEFVPMTEYDDHGKLKPNPVRHTLANVEVGQDYAVLLTNCAGQWANLIGDTVRFERRDPPLLKFTGRTKFFLSAFGEHLITEEVEAAVTHASKEANVSWVDLHVGPVFPADPKQPGYHLYLIEFRDAAPADMEKFATLIDRELCRLNEDYAAHRIGDLTMLRPRIRVVPPGGFHGWMKSRGKFGGQNKVPRMDNTAKLTQDLVAYLDGSKG